MRAPTRTVKRPQPTGIVRGSKYYHDQLMQMGYSLSEIRQCTFMRFVPRNCSDKKDYLTFLELLRNENANAWNDFHKAMAKPIDPDTCCCVHEEILAERNRELQTVAASARKLRQHLAKRIIDNYDTFLEKACELGRLYHEALHQEALDRVEQKWLIFLFTNKIITLIQ